MHSYSETHEKSKNAFILFYRRVDSASAAEGTADERAGAGTRSAAIAAQAPAEKQAPEPELPPAGAGVDADAGTSRPEVRAHNLQLAHQKLLFDHAVLGLLRSLCADVAQDVRHNDKRSTIVDVDSVAQLCASSLMSVLLPYHSRPQMADWIMALGPLMGTSVRTCEAVLRDSLEGKAAWLSQVVCNCAHVEAARPCAPHPCALHSALPSPPQASTSDSHRPGYDLGLEVPAGSRPCQVDRASARGPIYYAPLPSRCRCRASTPLAAR